MILAVFVLAACEDAAEHAMEDFVNKQMEIYNKIQPMRVYDWSAEIEIIDQIYDRRVETPALTWSVWVADGTGEPIDMCASRGYPIPYTTSRSNPLKGIGTNGATVGQIEPNGLYPGNTAATWVPCVEADGLVYPKYIESNVISYDHPVRIVYDERRGMYRIERVAPPDPSMGIDVDKPRK